MYGVRRKVNKLEKEVLRYEQQPVETGKILFYGHSLFTRWSAKWGNRPLEEDIRMKDGSPAAINHGIGSSTADDLLYYYHRLVKPYAPRVLILATGGNDFPLGYSAADVMDNLAKVIDYTRADFPDIPIYCFTCKPSSKHKGTTSYFTRLRDEFNEILDEYCAKAYNCTCIHVEDFPMFYENPADIGNYDAVREDLFIEDRTHFTQEGYDLFAQHVRQLLDEYL